MSHRIEYEFRTFLEVLPVSVNPNRYVVCVLGGDNNVYDHDGKRARSWDVSMVGDANAVLRKAVEYSADCEGGMLKLYGRETSPETYIRRIRRALAEAAPLDAFRYWTPNVQVSPDSPVVAYAQRRGLPVTPFKRYGEDWLRVEIDHAKRAIVFDIAAAFPDLPGWRLGTPTIIL